MIPFSEVSLGSIHSVSAASANPTRSCSSIIVAAAAPLLPIIEAPAARSLPILETPSNGVAPYRLPPTTSILVDSAFDHLRASSSGSFLVSAATSFSSIAAAAASYPSKSLVDDRFVAEDKDSRAPAYGIFIYLHLH